MKRLIEAEKKEQEFLGSSRDKVMFEDITGDKTVDISSDITSDKNSDIESDTNSYIKSDIVNIIKKKDKYTDIHIRKTHYFEKDLYKKVEKLCDRNNIDKSFIINEALRLFFKEIEGVK